MKMVVGANRVAGLSVPQTADPGIRIYISLPLLASQSTYRAVPVFRAGSDQM